MNEKKQPWFKVKQTINGFGFDGGQFKVCHIQIQTLWRICRHRAINNSSIRKIWKCENETSFFNLKRRKKHEIMTKIVDLLNPANYEVHMHDRCTLLFVCSNGFCWYISTRIAQHHLHTVMQWLQSQLHLNVMQCMEKSNRKSRKKSVFMNTKFAFPSSNKLLLLTPISNTEY